MKRIKKKTKHRKRVLVLQDVIKVAWEEGIACPPNTVKKLSEEEVAQQFPHLMLLYLAHRGRCKSHGLIQKNAKALARIDERDLLEMGPDDLAHAGVDVSNLLRMEAAAEA